MSRTKFGGGRRSWYNLGVARSCQVEMVALPSFPLPGFRPGVDSGEVDGSGDLCLNRGGCTGRRGGGVN